MQLNDEVSHVMSVPLLPRNTRATEHDHFFRVLTCTHKIRIIELALPQPLDPR